MTHGLVSAEPLTASHLILDTPYKTHNLVIDSRTPPRYHSLTLPPVIVPPVTAPPDTILYTPCDSYTTEHARPLDVSPLEFWLELGQDGGHASLSLGYGKWLHEAHGRTGVGVSKEVFEAVGPQKLVIGARLWRRRRCGAPARSPSARTALRNAEGFARTYLHRLAPARRCRGVAATSRCGVWLGVVCKEAEWG